MTAASTHVPVFGALPPASQWSDVIVFHDGANFPSGVCGPTVHFVTILSDPSGFNGSSFGPERDFPNTGILTSGNPRDYPNCSGPAGACIPANLAGLTVEQIVAAASANPTAFATQMVEGTDILSQRNLTQIKLADPVDIGSSTLRPYRPGHSRSSVAPSRVPRSSLSAAGTPAQAESLVVAGRTVSSRGARPGARSARRSSLCPHRHRRRPDKKAK